MRLPLQVTSAPPALQGMVEQDNAQVVDAAVLLLILGLAILKPAFFHPVLTDKNLVFNPTFAYATLINPS
jgi:hypothetical protein